MWNAYVGPSKSSPAHAIDAPLPDFTNLSDYAESVYSRGARMFRALNEKLGDKVFFEALILYYRQHRNQNVHERDLVNSFSEAAGRDMTGFFNEWGITLS
jgi:aminopeptidase N